MLWWWLGGGLVGRRVGRRFFHIAECPLEHCVPGTHCGCWRGGRGDFDVIEGWRGKCSRARPPMFSMFFSLDPV